MQWIGKHPIASETLIAGTVSTGFDIYNDKFTPEGAMMNYVLSGITAGKSLSKQLSINTIYQGIVSANDNTKNDKEVLGDVMKKDISTIISFGTANGVSKLGIVGNKVIVGSSIVGGIIENINVSPKSEEIKNKESK